MEPRGAGRLVVTDLEDRKHYDLLDLGAGALCGPGGFLVGRLVRSGATPGLMFDTTPIVVDQQTAEDVAKSTAGGWITALTKDLPPAGCRSGHSRARTASWPATCRAAR